MERLKKMDTKETQKHHAPYQKKKRERNSERTDRTKRSERTGVLVMFLVLHVRRFDMQRYRLSSYQQPALICPRWANRTVLL